MVNRGTKIWIFYPWDKKINLYEVTNVQFAHGSVEYKLDTIIGDRRDCIYIPMCSNLNGFINIPDQQELWYMDNILITCNEELALGYIKSNLIEE